jgi:hypothetical protein
MIDKGLMIDPLWVELCAVLERALNYMHTGNGKVLATSVMRPLWISQALLEHGLAALSPIVQGGVTMTDGIHVSAPDWPVNPANLQPYSAANRSQEFTYGQPQGKVSSICVCAWDYHESCRTSHALTTRFDRIRMAARFNQ